MSSWQEVLDVPSLISPRPLRNLAVRSRGLEPHGRVTQKTETPEEPGNQCFGHIAFSSLRLDPGRSLVETGALSLMFSASFPTPEL